MEDPQVLLAELKDSRDHAVALVRAKLEAVASQVQELANRTVGELQLVLPPDLEVLFPLAPVAPRLEALAAPPPPPPPAPVEPRVLDLATLRALDGGKAQSEVLQELLRQLGHFSGPRAIVVFRDGQAAGWAGAGFVGADPVRTWRGAINESPVLAKVSEGTPVLITVASDALLGEWFASHSGRLLAVPMLLRARVVGALLAVEGEEGLNAVVVQQLTFLVGLLLETLSVRAGVASATLAEPLDLTAPMEIPAAADVEAKEVVFGGPEEELVDAGQATIPPEEMAGVTAADAGATVHLKVPVAPVAPPPPERTPEEQKRHDEAKRFARLLVSEIRLYNEQAVQEGKRTRDIYRRLREDIDRSREMYEQRVTADIRAQSTYFQDELVRLLADGDPAALGM
ncbi:MAG: hypothetical protein KA072_02690 [Thermoanaerobaculaceae bacterium]|nr:hypothetical protein [Thermoanaerobaculaceae bacterium]MDI9620509.1 hypothetical protein [Acidobacteriota bacterium]NLH11086.1 hypothetical protein [Holophagae bacterium]HPW56246.1 hypothetical protein [Thermoanaerobaculaceae bacterium]